MLQQNAAYWVGLLLFDDRKYEVAAQWFRRPELSQADSTWAAGRTLQPGGRLGNRSANGMRP